MKTVNRSILLFFVVSSISSPMFCSAKQTIAQQPAQHATEQVAVKRNELTLPRMDSISLDSDDGTERKDRLNAKNGGSEGRDTTRTALADSSSAKRCCWCYCFGSTKK